MFELFRPIALALALIAAASAQAGDLSSLVGHWSCRGSFANGAPIAAELSIEGDKPSGALIVRHDDLPPQGYHSLEVWMPNSADPGLRAALTDKFSGMRWFESTGWVADTLTWVRMKNGAPAEQFVYELKANTLQVQWSTVKDGAMKVGDTILCHRG